MISERSIPNIPESTFWSEPVLGETAGDPVTIRRVSFEDGSELYSAESNRLLGRNAIDAIIRQPLDEPEYGWREVRNSLQSFGYDSRKMQRFGQRARKSDHLAMIRGASSQLADTLIRNQSEHVISATVPVLDYNESRQFAANALLNTNSRRLLLQLKSLGYDVRTASYFSGFIGSYSGASPFAPDAIEQLGPSVASLEKEIVNGAILSEASRAVEELLNRTRYDLFDEFPVDGVVIPDEKYIMKSDIPIGVSRDGTTSISVGRSHAMPTRDGRERHHVRFLTRQTPVFARPLLMWRKDARGNRSLRFAAKGFDQVGEDALAVPRASSLIGVAQLANMFGRHIGYKPELFNRLRKGGIDYSNLGRAGLFPLVADFGQDQLTGSPYVEEIEYILR